MPIRRRAVDRDGRLILPMTLGNMREHGVTRVELSCVAIGCGFRKSVAVTAWPDSYPVPDVGRRVPCPACGVAELDSRPDWSGFKAAGRPPGLR